MYLSFLETFFEFFESRLAELAQSTGEDLPHPRPTPVNGDPFTTEVVRQDKGLPDIVLAGIRGEVYGLGDGVVGMPLKGGLHLYMTCRRDLKGGDEELPNMRGHISLGAQESCLSEGILHLGTPKPHLLAQA